MDDFTEQVELRQNATPISREIHYIWVGGVMKLDEDLNGFPAYRRGIEFTAQNLKGDPEYTINIWLSKELSTNEEAYEENATWANEMGLQIRSIDDELDFHLSDMEKWAIRMEANTEQPNFGAISDILRVAILDSIGGMYIDTDCVLLRRPEDEELVPKYGIFLASSQANKSAVPPNHVHHDESKIKSKKRGWSFFSCCCNNNGSDDPTITIVSFSPSPGVTNSVIGSIPKGQFIQRYRKFITEEYRKIQDNFSGDEEVISNYLFKNRSDGTLYRSGPEALKISSRIFHIDGKNVFEFWQDHRLSNDPDRRAMIFPDYVSVQYGNSWKGSL